MKKKIFFNALLVALLALAATFQIVLAHETVTVGDYQIEIGWVNEPPIVGQQNDVVVNVTKAEALLAFRHLLILPNRVSKSTWPSRATPLVAEWLSSTRRSRPATVPCAFCRPSWLNAREIRISRYSRWRISKASPVSPAILR